MTCPRHSVLIWSHKGGVGKSTVAAHLGLALHRSGTRVGLFDADVTGPSMPALFGLDSQLAVRRGLIQPAHAHGMPVVSTGILADPDHPFVWHGPLLRGAIHQLLHDTEWPSIDLLIVDMPPGTGETQLAIIDELPITAAIVVTTPHGLAEADAVRGLGMLRQADIPVVAVIENMVSITCPACTHTWAPFPATAGVTVAGECPEAVLLSIPMTQILAGPIIGRSADVPEALEELARVIRSMPFGT